MRIKKQDTSVTTLDKVFDLVEEQCEVVYFPQPALRERGRNLGLKMAREKDPKNIFEAAGSGKKKPEENSKITSFEEIFSRCQKMHEEIANTLDENLERSKISSSAIRSYISRPQNFSQKDWKTVEEQKKKNEKILKELAQKISHRKIPEESEEKGKPKKKGKKKRKVMTKRRWLKMG